MAECNIVRDAEEILQNAGFGYRGVNPHIYFANKEHYKDSLKFNFLECRLMKDDAISFVKYVHPDKDPNTSIYSVSEVDYGDIHPSDNNVRWLDLSSLTKQERETIESVEESLKSIKLYSETQKGPWSSYPGPLVSENGDTGVIGKEYRQYRQLYAIQSQNLFEMIKGFDIPEEQKQQALRSLNAMNSIIKEGERHHHRSLAFLLANAFYNNMHKSEGKAGIVALFEMAVELVDSKRLTIFCHGGSPHDAHGFSIGNLDISALKEDIAIEQSREPPLAGSARSSPSPSQMSSRPVSRSSSVTPPTKRRRMTSSSSGSESCLRGVSHNDVTIFSVSDSEINPILLVEIKVGSTINENQFVKYLLGALQFRDEVFGIIINSSLARFYKMFKTVENDQPAIHYFHKLYRFARRPATVEDGYYLFDNDKLVSLFRDILSVLTYSLHN